MELLSPSFSVYIPASKYLQYNVINRFLTVTQGTRCTGKMAKKNPREEKHRELGNFAENREFGLFKL